MEDFFSALESTEFPRRSIVGHLLPCLCCRSGAGGLGSNIIIAPHRRTRQKPKTQDGRKLRRYKRRWKVERLFAWLGNFRRLVVRYEHKVNNFLGFVHLGCIVILLGRFAGLECVAKP